MPPSVPDQHLDAMARAKGFPSYAAMAAFYRHRSEGLQQPGESHQTEIQNGVDTALSIHPARLLDYVLRKYHEATGQQ